MQEFISSRLGGNYGRLVASFNRSPDLSLIEAAEKARHLMGLQDELRFGQAEELSR